MQVPHSPVFAGREHELNQLAEALEEARTGATRLVIVTADAGAGKSRLLHEFTARHARDCTILSGGCTDQAESGLPYAPVSAAIRRLVRERGAFSITELVGTPSAGDLAWLLPEFGAPRSLPDMTIVRSRLFEVVRLLVERLAQDQPLLWLLEDMHWADTGSADMLRFLAANVVDVPILLVMTSRPVSRDSAVRSLLAELGRTPFARTIQLPRLARGEVAQQLRGILGHEPAPELLHRVFARGGGIPLFTEAVAAAGETGSAALPVPMHELLLGPVRALPSQTQRLLRIASLSDSLHQPQLVAAVAGLDIATFDDHLRPALDASVLILRDEGYAFRHELIREAVECSMPLQERKRWHATLARVMTADPSLGSDSWITVALAHHWHLAGEPARGLTAAWQAAAEAVSARSQATRLEMLELVLAQWSSLPDPESLVGVPLLEVMAQAADAACWAAQPKRGLAHVEPALAMARAIGDDARVAELLLQRAPMRQQLAVPGQQEDLDEALRRTANMPRLRVEALGQACRASLARDRLDDAAACAKELGEVAAALGDEAGRLDSEIMVAWIASRRGEDAVGQLESLLKRCYGLDSGWLECVAMNALIECHLAAGRPELAAGAGARAVRRCMEVGQWSYLGAAIAQNEAEALAFLGRWDEALAVLDHALDSNPAPLGRAQLLIVRGTISAQRGDIQTASGDLAKLQDLPPDLMPRPIAIRTLELDILWAQGDRPRAIELTSAFQPSELMDCPRDAWPWMVRALRVHACAGPRSPAMDNLDALAAQLPRPGPVEQTYADQAAAELARGREVVNSAAWNALARRWAALGQIWQQAYALLRAAATESARTDVAARLQDALSMASRLGAQPLLQRLDVVAQRRRLRPQSASAGGTQSPFRLTERELEVLRLLAEGKTNRQIAALLVISVKTASVHVTNILSKLDVRTRGAAAAVAHRLGLTGLQ